MGEVDQAVEEVARASYGRLVAYLTSTTSDLAAAEDALADAFEAALRTWPDRGIPDRPTSWMITAARRTLIGRSRRRQVAERALPSLALLAEERAEPGMRSVVGDKRLELLFTCAHPAIDERTHAPLMLQTVLGVDVARMAPVFQVPATTLGQRLVRAKRRIRDAGIPFGPPAPSDLTRRADAVLDAIYAAYGTGWEDPLGEDEARTGLVDEAIRLAELTTELLPDHPEAEGLLALLLHSDARRATRRDDDGRLVPLAEQDTARWRTDLIDHADAVLARAFASATPGRYQLHAAIQSLHNRRAATGTTSWTAIAALYDALVVLDPTIGGHVARSAAYLEASGPTAALALLDALPTGAIDAYQPYWAVRAEVLRRLDDDPGDRALALRTAIALASDRSVADHLRTRGGVRPVGVAP